MQQPSFSFFFSMVVLGGEGEGMHVHTEWKRPIFMALPLA